MHTQKAKAKELLESFAYNKVKRTGQDKVQEINLQGIREIAQKSGLSVRSVEILALESGFIPKRYQRNLHTLTIKDQISLLKAEIVVVGVGGLGGYLLEMLCRLGVGRIIIVDGDSFEESNLNRQLMVTENNLGQKKARAAKNKMTYVNSSVGLEVVEQFLGRKELEVLLKGKNLAVDALGGLAVRKNLLVAAENAGLPLVSGFIAGATGCVSTIFPGEKGLLSMWEGQHGAEEYLGSLVHTVTAIASMQCAEVVNLLCASKQARLRKKMAVCDLMQCSWEFFELSG